MLELIISTAIGAPECIDQPKSPPVGTEWIYVFLVGHTHESLAYGSRGIWPSVRSNEQTGEPAGKCWTVAVAVGGATVIYGDETIRHTAAKLSVGLGQNRSPLKPLELQLSTPSDLVRADGTFLKYADLNTKTQQALVSRYELALESLAPDDGAKYESAFRNAWSIPSTVALSNPRPAPVHQFAVFESTGIVEIDKIFQSSQDVLQVIQSLQETLNSELIKLNTLLHVASDTPFERSLRELKKQGAGQIGHTERSDGTIQLSTTTNAPQNVQDAVALLNAVTSKLSAGVAELQRASQEANAVATYAASISPILLSSSEVRPTNMAIITKKVSYNLDILKSTPSKAAVLTREISALHHDLDTVFGGSE